MDRINLRLLELLQRDARAGNQYLASEVGLSESACHERVKKLYREAYLHSSTANINLKKVPHVHFIVSVGLKNQTAALTKKFCQLVDALPEVTCCYKVSGEYDYVLHFVCTDAARFNHLSEDLIARDLGIEKMSTQLVIDTTKPFRGYPLAALFNDGR